jgi:CRISPR-associated protein Csd1
MGWISLLNETYENNSSFAGKIDKDDTVLLPISHSTQNAQIEVTIDEYGEFLRAEKITDKENAVTIIPVTEDSGAMVYFHIPYAINYAILQETTHISPMIKTRMSIIINT